MKQLILKLHLRLTHLCEGSKKLEKGEEEVDTSESWKRVASTQQALSHLLIVPEGNSHRNLIYVDAVATSGFAIAIELIMKVKRGRDHVSIKHSAWLPPP